VPVAEAQIFVNLLANPSFEVVVQGGDNTGWDRRGPTSITLNQIANPVQDGFYALEVGGRNTSEVKVWYGVKQDLTGILAANTNYILTAYGRLSSGQGSDNLTLQLIKKLSDGSTVYQTLASGSVTDGAFSFFESEFSFTETNVTELILSVHGPTGGKSFILDNFVLYDPNAPPPAGDTLSPEEFVFKSSGQSDGSGGWTLDKPGYIGSFFNNVGTSTVEATMRLDLTGIEYLAEGPVVEIFTGVTREERTLNGGGNTEYFTFDLPPGKHTLRIGFKNPSLNRNRSVTVTAVEVFGTGILFDNTEANVLPASENTVEYFRKQPFQLVLHDDTGMRLGPGSVVTMEPILPQFNFGVGVKGWNSNTGTADRRDWVDPSHPDYASLQPVRDFLASNFNTIVTNNAGKWAPVENNRDVLDYGLLDLIQGFARDNDLRLRLHALAWAKSGGNPSWALDLMNNGLAGNTADKNDLRAEISERITDYITGRAGEWIQMDGINEGYHQNGLRRLYGFQGVADIYEETHDALRAMGATTPVYFNEFGTFNRFNDAYATWWVDHIHNILSYIPAEKRDDGFGIGHQSYVSNKSSSGSYLDPTTYYQVLQNSASMGLPIAITEFGVKQEPAPVPTYMESAELLRQAMTIAMGNDRVDTFIVWNFLEGEMYTNATAAPMLLDDGNYTLTDFGRAWQHLTGQVDHSDVFPSYPRFAGAEQVSVGDDGRLHYRGLPGRYRISNGDFSYEADLTEAGEFILNGPPVRNVLMIVVDDLKPTIGAYGDPHAVTPVMDQLAAEGVMFTNTHCQMAICAPSRASVLTGLRPDYTGVLDLTTQVRDVHPGIITLPQHFSNYGYTTHGISKIFHGTNAQVQDSPISWNDGWQAHGVTKRFYEPGKSEEEDQLRSQGQNGAANKVSATDRGVAVDTDYGDGVAAQKGVARIVQYAADFKNNDKPFFLAVGFQKPHLPFNAPEAYWELYDQTDFGMSAYAPFFDYPEGAPTFARPFSGEPGSYGDGWAAGDEGIILAPDAVEARRLVQGYYACASFIDAQVGKLLDALETQGIADDTIVILWSDHGFHLGDHGAFWAKHSNYEQATRSVLMVRAPGVTQAGGVVESPTELVDIFPTLCQLTGLPLPIQPDIGPLQGNGLEQLLRDPSRPWRKAAFSQYHRNNDGLKMGYSMRTHEHRLTAWFPRGELTDPSTTGDTPVAEELYDYRAAPDEPVNLISSPDYSQVLARLRPVMLGDRWDDPRVAQPFDNPAFISPVADWKTAYFPLDVDATGMNDTDDPDFDGLPVAIEYLLGLSPVVPDAQAIHTSLSSPGGGNLSLLLEYPSPLMRPDYALSPKWSSDLTSWSSSGLTLSTDAASSRDRVSVPVSEPPAFLRLEAVAP
jgi:arylsulfatase A-like enzyme/GH35 family endo-1,4-beta-xylanase